MVGLTEKQLAQLIDVDDELIKKIENGEIKPGIALTERLTSTLQSRLDGHSALQDEESSSAWETFSQLAGDW